MLTSGSMSQIWGMINSMQIYSNLPVFQIEVPSYSTSALTSLLEISSFEIIPTSWVMERLLVAPDEDGEDASESAEAIGLDSYYMISNMGAMLVIFFWCLLGLPVVLLLLQLCQSRLKCAKNKADSLKNSLYG